MQTNYQKTLARLGALCAASATAFAGSVSYNFDTDPNGILSFYGNAAYVSTDGNPATGGYLSLTDAINSQRSFIVFDDFDNGLVVKAFSFSMDVRIGGGNTTPADGFSVDYVRANDPVLVDPSSMNGWASNPGGEANLPEEGSTTGLGIGFDAYDSGNGDVIGISVRLDNVLIATYPLPNQNTTCDDQNSLQTGPIDPDNAGSPGLLCWQPFSVDLSETGKLVIKWKGHEITPAGGLQTTFIPSPGRLVLVARTGGLNQNQHIDNLKITTIASSTPTVGQINAQPAGFSFDILDAGADKVDSSTVTVKLNGTSVTPVVSKTGDTTSVSFNEFPTLIPAGSSNTIVVSFKDNFGNPLSVTRDYVQTDYAVVPPALALPAGATTTTPGFVLKSYQTAAGNGNSLALTQDELSGLLGANLADLSAADANGLFHEPGVINYDKDPATDGKQGNFDNDGLIPGFPGSGPNQYDNAALEATTYLKFPAAGVYTMGVSSDDGFRVTIAKSAGQKLGGVTLGQYIGGRGAGIPGTLFTFVVQQAGFYPARLIWENGGGGSSVEWFSVKTNGSYVLVNDTTDPEAILAYQTSSVVSPYVDLVTPNADKILEGQVVGPADPIRIELVDGTPATVNAGSIALSVNGAPANPTVTKTGGRTTLLVNNTFPNLLPAGSTNKLTLVYADTATPANTYSNSWSFVVSKYVTIPADLGSPIGSGDSTKPGFRIKTWQLDVYSPTVGTAGANQAQNRVAYAEQELLGLFGTNAADLTLTDSNHYFHETGVINYTKDPAADGQQGNFGGEAGVPGIPGNTQYSLNVENYSLEIQTYAEFPTAGLYTMGVSSDDGFAVTVATAPGPLLALNINSPAAIAGRMGAVASQTDEGGPGIGRPLTAVPVTGKVVYANPPLADAPLINAAAIAGNIALIDRGVVAFSAKAQAALDAGAIGVIIVNNRDTNSTDGILPNYMTGTPVNIPAVQVGLYDGQKIKDHLADAGGVTVSLGADNSLRLGAFNDGRGADAGTLFSFVIPQAGVYPLRNVTFQGGGGGNVEWFSVANDGTKILVNDTATAGSIKTYQALTVVTSPTVSVSKNATEVVITFTGTLEASDSVNGTYAPVAGATSPLHVPFATGAGKFYRTRN